MSTLNKVSPRELVDFIDPEKNPKSDEIFMELTLAEIKSIGVELSTIRQNDFDKDGKLSFEEFLTAMKENKKLNKLVLKIANSKMQPSA